VRELNNENIKREGSVFRGEAQLIGEERRLLFSRRRERLLVD